MGRKQKNMDDRGIGIKPCPVCGRRPKNKCEGVATCGWTATIWCKPLFQEPHLKVEVAKASWLIAERSAITEWNRKADSLWEKRLYKL